MKTGKRRRLSNKSLSWQNFGFRAEPKTDFPSRLYGACKENPAKAQAESRNCSRNGLVAQAPSGWTAGFFVVLALAAALCPAPLAAQASARPEEQSFDYDPGAGKAPRIQQLATETTFEDAVLVNHSIYGIIMFSKHRWKSWVTRALYLALINIALIAIILSLSKTEEHNIIVAYVLSGAGFAVSFWTFLCAALIFQLDSNAWIYVLPVSAATGAAGYIVLMKIKKSDVSLTELKESFKKMRTASYEDQRLISVEGPPGDWPNEDFIR